MKKLLEYFRNHLSPALLFIVFISLFFCSCKKSGSQLDETEVNKVKQRAIEATIKNYGNVGPSFKIDVNKQATEIFYKENGQLVPFGKSGRNTTFCTYDCSNAPSGSDLDPDYTLFYVRWTWECGTTNGQK